MYKLSNYTVFQFSFVNMNVCNSLNCGGILAPVHYTHLPLRVFFSFLFFLKDIKELIYQQASVYADLVYGIKASCTQANLPTAIAVTVKLT